MDRSSRLRERVFSCLAAATRQVARKIIQFETVAPSGRRTTQCAIRCEIESRRGSALSPFANEVSFWSCPALHWDSHFTRLSETGL